MDPSLFKDLLPLAVAALRPSIEKLGIYAAEFSLTEEYETYFRDLIDMADGDLEALQDEVKEIYDLSDKLNVDMSETDGAPWHIGYKLSWYLDIQYRHLGRKITNLCNQFQDSINDITNVVACIAGITSFAEGGGLSSTSYPVSDALATMWNREQALLQMAMDPREVALSTLLEELSLFVEDSRLALDDIRRGFGARSDVEST